MPEASDVEILLRVLEEIKTEFPRHPTAVLADSAMRDQYRRQIARPAPAPVQT